MTTLGDALELQRGHDLPESMRRPGNVPVIGSAGVTGYHDTARVAGPGVTMGRSGAAFGKVTYVREDYWPHNASLFVKDFKGNSVLWVRYLLESIDFTSMNSGSAQQSLNRNFLYGIPVGIPPLAEQRRIAGILFAYDDLIENCERRIRVLDKMARALYREWFVLFRYPGHEKSPLVDSPLGRIPKGWRATPAKDVATVTYGFPFKSPLFAEEPDGRTPIVRIRDIPNGASVTYTSETAEPRYEIRDGDLLVGMDGDFHMGIWSNGRAYQNQRVARFRPTDAWATRHFLLALEPRIQSLNASIVGTTVAHLGDAHIREIRVVEPSGPVLAMARGAFRPIGEAIAVLEQSVRNLRKTRDLLLPRLLSRELPVDDAA